MPKQLQILLFVFSMLAAMLAAMLLSGLLVHSCEHKETATTLLDGGKLIKSDTAIQYHYHNNYYTAAPQSISKTDSFFIPVPAKIDTLSIIRKFFTEYLYCDTIKDSNLIATNKLWIAQNRVIADSFRYKLLRPDIEKIITNTIEAPPKCMVLVGASAGINKNLVASFGPELFFIDKKRRAYGAGYDILNKSFEVKFLMPIIK